MVVWCLQPYRQYSLHVSGVEKLKRQFYGPFKEIKTIGEITYELELPSTSKIHNMFHVSCLKKALGQQVIPSIELPRADEEGKSILIPETIFQVREKKLRSKINSDQVEKLAFGGCNVGRRGDP